MLFRTFGNKTVKELRKNQGLTARELAEKVQVTTSVIRRVEHFQFKKVPEPLKSKLEPVLRGKQIDQAPW